jgi:hypothetical protein
MAIETRVILTCDMHGEDKPRKAEKTVTLGIDRNTVEMELCPVHLRGLTAIMAEYLPYARRASNGTKASLSGKRTYRPRAERAESTAIREWAHAGGISVNARGRIPRDVIAMYEARET